MTYEPFQLLYNFTVLESSQFYFTPYNPTNNSIYCVTLRIRINYSFVLTQTNCLYLHQSLQQPFYRFPLHRWHANDLHHSALKFSLSYLRSSLEPSTYESVYSFELRQRIVTNYGFFKVSFLILLSNNCSSKKFSFFV